MYMIYLLACMSGNAIDCEVAQVNELFYDQTLCEYNISNYLGVVIDDKYLIVKGGCFKVGEGA